MEWLEAWFKCSSYGLFHSASQARLHQTLDQELHERCQAVGLKSVTGTESNPLHGIWQIRTCSTRSCSALHFLLSHLVTSCHILCQFIAQWWRRKGYWSDGPILLIGHVSGTSCMMQTGSIRGTSQCAQYPCYPEKANRVQACPSHVCCRDFRTRANKWPHSKICNCMHCMLAQLLPPNMLWPHLPSSFPLPADKIQPKHGQTPPIISKGTFPNSVIDIPRPCPSIVDWFVHLNIHPSSFSSCQLSSHPSMFLLLAGKNMQKRANKSTKGYDISAIKRMYKTINITRIHEYPGIYVYTCWIMLTWCLIILY